MGPDYLAQNVATWQARHDTELALAERQWAADEETWGIFGIPESEVRLLPHDVRGLDVAEVGCGTAYVSAWLTRRGAKPVALDPTPGQLAIARQMQEKHAVRFPLVRAAGEGIPLRDASVDLVISEYGAAIWADPYKWLPEAARILRPGGELTFLGNSVVMMLCAPDEDGVPATEAMVRAQFGIHRFEWPDSGEIEFHLSHGDMIALLRRCGFVVEELIELRAPVGSTTSYGFVTAEWAAQWPCEEVWRARRQ
ncbi:MAG TPA: class I SAM-dependent methyltransferase [Acidimicrobiales bacterium]|nr:class I SAM-dependent methyltransferase [Acidimicrobiales bacterium]